VKIISVKSLAIPDVKVVRFARFRDHRGFFAEPFRRSDMRNYPDDRCFERVEFVQTNESYSHAGVVRGLHLQWNPYMGKLVRTIAGHMVDLVLDIRKGSPFFGKIIAYDMPASVDAEYGEWIWVPPGFAHGNFFTEPSQIEYSCSGEYSPGCEAGISPLTTDLDWSLCEAALKAKFDETIGSAILSPKDRDGLSLTAWNNDARSENFIFGQC
jgi:dTDP-4-dehydrorhamnose 3,5-epimerase